MPRAQASIGGWSNLSSGYNHKVVEVSASRNGQLDSGGRRAQRRQQWQYGASGARVAYVAALLLVGLVATAGAEPRRIVVAFANNKGLADDRPLIYANKDAERFADVMLQVGGVRKRDVHLLLDATRGQVLAKLASLAEQVEPHSTLFAFYSGHGSEGALHLGDEKLSLKLLKSALAAVEAHLTLTFIDACRGGTLTKGSAPPDRFELEVSKGFERSVPFPLRTHRHTGHVMIHAAGPGELAVESAALEGGIFTHNLINGMLGSADENNNGLVQLSEAYIFAYHETQKDMRSRGVDVAPSIEYNLEGQGPLILTQLDNASSHVRLPSSTEEARYYVVAKGGGVVAEARSKAGRSVRLALPSAGQFVVHQETEGAQRRTEIALPLGGTRTLEQDDFSRVTDNADRGIAGRELFLGQSPFPHRLGVAATLQADNSAHAENPASHPDNWSPEKGLSLSYAYGTSGWMPSVGISVWHREYEPERTQSVAARRVGMISAGLRYQWVLPLATLHVGSGLAAMGIRQRVLGSSRRHHHLAGGIYSSLGASFPFTGRLSLDAALSGLASLHKPDATAPRRLFRLRGQESAILMSIGLAVGL